MIQLLDDFLSIKYLPNGNLGCFLCNVKQVAELLHEVGHTLQSLYIGYQMIKNLPERFQSTIQAIYWWPDSDFAPDKIEREELLEEQNSNSSNVAFSSDIKCKADKSF